jgi:hypothetical protein
MIVFFAGVSWAQTVSVSAGTTYTQSFDSLGTAATGSLPYGWKVGKNVTAVAQTVGSYSATTNVTATSYSAGNSMSSTSSGGIYNFGAGVASTATDRALGGISSGSSAKNLNIYTSLKNNGGNDISSFNISYKVEKYRMGTNAAGFTVQLFYSTTGDSLSWVSAGTDFKASFAGGNASNTGYTTAPGDSVVISNKTLSVTLAAGSTLYLAWNYSVSSGTTMTNAQALGIDDINITPIGATVAPTTQATNVSFSSVGQTGFTVGWTNGNGAGRIAKINTSNSFTATDGTAYTANTIWAGSGEQTIYNGTGTSVAVTGLDAGTTYYVKVFEYNGSGTGVKYLTANGTTNNPNSQATTAAAGSSASDIIANASFTTPTNIDYASHQEASLTSSSLEVAEFNIRDGGATTDADNFATTLTNISFTVANSSVLREVGLFDGATKIAEVAAGSTITFNGLSLAAADGASKTISLRASFAAAVTDNTQFSFTVSSATALATGSLFADANAGGATSSTTGNANKISVTASKLNYVQQPTAVAVDAVMSPAVTVEAVDALGNRDLDYVTSVSLTANGTTLTGSPVAATPVSGLATFGTLSFSAAGAAATLTAASGALTNATSSSFAVQAPTTYTWTGATDVAWATATNWSPSRTTALSNDILVFNNGVSDSVVIATNQTVGRLTVTGSTTLKMVGSASVTLTVGNGSGTDLNVDAGSAFNLSGSSNALTLALPTGATGSVSGTMLCEGATQKIIPVDSASLTFQNGSILTQNCASNIFNSTGNANAVVFASGSKFVFMTGSNPFALTAPASRVLFKTGSTYVQASSQSPSVSNRVYANFEYNYSGTLSLTGASPFTVDNIVIDQGILNLNLTGGTVVKGNINVTGGTLTFTPTTGNVTFSGTAQQSITNSGTLTFASTATVILNNNLGLYLNSDLAIAGTLTLTSGALDVGNAHLILGSAATISGTPSSANMIVSSGTGSVKKVLTAAVPHSFTFPVGDVNGTSEYSPVTYTLNSGTFTADTVGIAVSNTKNSNISNGSNYLNRYWTLTLNGVTTPSYDAVFTYLPADVVGTESSLAGAVYGGSAWTNVGAVNSSAHTFTASAQAAGGIFSAKSFVTSGDVTVKVIPQGFYNSGALNQSDTIKILLANTTTPYAVVDSAFAILDSVSLTATGTFSAAASGSYYIVVKHRSSVETWSASSITFTQGSTVSYDFTSAASQAYGNNETEVATGVFAIYSGDCNQDGYVDPLDLSLVDQDSYNYVSGSALATDVNGDRYVDPLDLSIVDQNSYSYVGIMKPTATKMISAKERAQNLPYYQKWLKKRTTK